MKALTMFLISVGSVGLLYLGACSRNPNASPGPSTPSSADMIAQSPASHPQTAQGGQVIESGPYHLEFVPEKEDQGTHLHFYLQKGNNHEPIPTAKVTAQVQLPDGTQKSLNLRYGPEGKHYTVMFAGSNPGEHQVVFLSDINGEKVNGRFSFKR